MWVSAAMGVFVCARVCGEISHPSHPIPNQTFTATPTSASSSRHTCISSAVIFAKPQGETRILPCVSRTDKWNGVGMERAKLGLGGARLWKSEMR